MLAAPPLLPRIMQKDWQVISLRLDLSEVHKFYTLMYENILL